MILRSTMQYAVSAVLAFFLLTGPVLAQDDAPGDDTATIQGMVTDGENGEPLPGANVRLLTTVGRTVAGSATNVDGTYQIRNVETGRYELVASFVGYQTVRKSVRITSSGTVTRDFVLQLEEGGLDEVVVSASRREEKIIDAPASVTVVPAQQIENSLSTNSVDALNSVVGVDMARTGINRREVTLRGFNNAFSSATLVLTDYREASAPVLDVNLYSAMPNESIDLDRVEVVRGPGSALYGPGVADGVIHFFSRDPIDDPGTTVELKGGSREYVGFALRHAQSFNDTFGYKIVGGYSQAKDFQMDTDTPGGRDEVERYRIYEEFPENAEGRNVEVGDFLPEAPGNPNVNEYRLRREEDYWSYNGRVQLAYEPAEETSIKVDGGLSQVKVATQSQIGTLQSDAYYYGFGQARVRSGGFFGQVYYNRIDDGGNSYTLGSGESNESRSFLWNVQTQYDFSLSSLQTDFVAGADADLARPRSNGTIYGRYEDKDNISEYGAYLQSTTSLTEWFDLVLAVRGDYNNVVEQLRGAPRVAGVFRLNSSQSIRASYNRSYASPAATTFFLDTEAQSRSVGSIGDREYNLRFQALGAVEGFSFDSFRQNGDAIYFVPGSLFGQPTSLESYPAGGPLLLAGARFEQRLDTGASLGEAFEGLDTSTLSQFAGLLDVIANNSRASLAQRSEGDLVIGIPDQTQPLGYDPVQNVSDIDALGQPLTENYELGYRGQFGNFRYELATYYEKRQNFIGPLRIESPLVYLSRDYVQNVVQDAIANDPDARQAYQDFLQESGLPEGQVAELLVGTFGSLPSGVINPDVPEELGGNVLPGGNTATDVGGLITSRQFGEVDYYGADLSLEYRTESLALYATGSFVSDDFFDNEDLGVEDEDLALALNAPQWKGGGGIDYRFDSGIMLGASGEYVDSFPVESGPYSGVIESYAVFNLRVGYDASAFVDGLRMDISAENIFDEQHREFVGAPQIGRLIYGRLRYTLR